MVIGKVPRIYLIKRKKFDYGQIKILLHDCYTPISLIKAMLGIVLMSSDCIGQK